MSCPVLDTSEFIESVIRRLDSGEYSAALESFSNNAKYIKSDCWDLIPKLCKNLTKNIRETNANLYVCSQQLLEVLARNADPEELILEFLEQLDEPDEIKFPIILSLLKITLLRELTNMKNSLEWCLNSVRSYLKQISTSEFGCGKILEEICTILKETLKITLLFYEELIHHILKRNKGQETEIIKMLLISRLVQLCDICLPYTDDNIVTDIQSQILDLISSLISNPYILLEHVFYRTLNTGKSEKNPILIKNINVENLREITEDFSSVDDRQCIFEDVNIISNLAYGMFFYSVLFTRDEKLNKYHLPLVYSPKFMFLALSFVTISFFEEDNNVAVRKGLKLLEFSLDRLHDKDLAKSDLSFSHHKTLLVHVNNIMVYSESKENRCIALKCFNSYISLFDWEARYWLLFYYRNDLEHSGTLGYIITMFKDFLSEFLNLPPESKIVKQFSRYYRGKLLFDMVKKYCFLSERQASELVENADHIISSLNLLRFLVIRDKTNITGVKLFIEKIDIGFLKPLKESVTTLKNHYEVRIKDTEKNQSEFTSNVEVSIKSSLLPKLTKEEERNAYMLALNAVDVIDSLLNRLMECISEIYSYRF